MGSFKCVCVKLFFYRDNMEYNKLMYNINYTTPVISMALLLL